MKEGEGFSVKGFRSIFKNIESKDFRVRGFRGNFGLSIHAMVRFLHFMSIGMNY